MSNRVFPDSSQPPVAASPLPSLNVIGLPKPNPAGGPDERYIFLFHDNEIPKIYETLGRWMADPELSFDEADVREVDAQLKAIGRTA